MSPGRSFELRPPANTGGRGTGPYGDWRTELHERLRAMKQRKAETMEDTSWSDDVDVAEGTEEAVEDETPVETTASEVRVVRAAWAIEVDGVERPGRFDSKAKAVSAARATAKLVRPSRLVIEGARCTVTENYEA